LADRGTLDKAIQTSKDGGRTLNLL